MAVGAILEPLVVVLLLTGGVWVNRSKSSKPCRWQRDNGCSTPSSTSGLLESGQIDSSEPDNALPPRAWSPSLLHRREDHWHTRQLRLLSFRVEVTTPNTVVFQDRLLSRVLQRFPFLVECWYWALVYWTYQLGRAFTALTLQDETVDIARKHALQLVHIEQRLQAFWEVSIQHFFLQRPHLLTWINWVYSFIHIPGTIAFLVCLYYFTTSRPESSAGPRLYQARRRTLAACNLVAFVIFTVWPCMPPRLLSDKNATGPDSDLARSYGFVDTVHGANGAGSVWTENRFCNQYAAMPSLHFGYSLLIGATIMTIPLSQQQQQRCVPWRRLACCLVGFCYPFLILVAIVATANHFILDAVAGALVCALGWRCNRILLNLLPLEDYFLSVLRIHKPEPCIWVDDARDEHTLPP